MDILNNIYICFNRQNKNIFEFYVNSLYDNPKY